ncbi:ARC6/PARC6 family protein [Synechococcus elongatus]|uniref:ARC6/PARC6 family protein n=1 Tax=Synechococcus elongatus TaxID=32046 RepID=UPI000F7E825B|nr:ARC6/PARC6 family protein [Synechococcus elongatus]
MRIPLDYYRILCVGVQVSADKLAESYRDRLNQSPSHEFSELALQARRQLLEAAIAELSDPEQRDRYDCRFFQGGLEAIEPSLELEDWQRIGALLILLELGEYDRVSQLAEDLLPDYEASAEVRDQFAQGDIALAIALSQQALGRECRQQGLYEQAALHFGRSQSALADHQRFPELSRTLHQEQGQLRPYRILERLAQPLTAASDRQQGLVLLQAMLDERQGIEGPGDDGSGLTLDNFLLFLQQIRSYLTLAEQQLLFESEARRPSPAASFFACYTLIARGFCDHQPSLIHRASLLLQELKSRMDVHIEQAIASLLLGQPEEAEALLVQSQDEDTLGQIRTLAQGEALIVGLCRFTETWLATKVFPDFRDLKERTAPLQPYFDDPDVQTYLDAIVELPSDLMPTPLPVEPLEVRSSLLAKELPTPATPGVAPPTRRRRRDRSERPARTAKRLPLPWIGLGVVVVLGGGTGVWAWRLRSNSTPPTPPPVVQTLPEAVPAPSPAPVTVALDRAQAETVLQNWLAAKAAALGPQYDRDRLATVLTGEVLQTWQGFSSQQANTQLTSQFDHKLTVDSVQLSDGDQRAVVQAKVDEVEQVYRGDQLLETRRDLGLVIRYQLVRENNIWKIASISLVR